MSNYVIIPIDSDNPARPFVAGAVDGPFTWASASGTITSGAASTAQAIVGGSGASAQATVTASGTALGNITVTITIAGDDYKVGDVVTIAAYTGGAATKWTEPLQFEIAAGDLVVGDSQAEELLPVDDVACVDVVNTGATIDILLKQATALKKWTLTLAGGTADNYEDIAIHVNDAIQQAMQAENKQPTMTFPFGVSCYDVVLV